MGSIGGMFGLNGGVAGSGIAGPQQANIANPVTADQISQAYTGSQNSLQSQQALLQALQNQNGLANQNQVYNQLQGVANGTGPNPAQAMLNQSTGQNVANTAALMAGQRGAGANVGLLARQAGQVGANAQQQAVGQGATMQANQALNAISAAGNLANQQANQQIGQTNANVSAQQAEQQNLLGAQGQYNSALTGSQQSVNNANAAAAGSVMGAQQGVVGGIFGGIGAGLMGKADGGIIEKPKMMAFGGSPSGGGSSFGKALSAFGSNMSSGGQQPGQQNPLMSGMTQLGKGIGSLFSSPAPAPQPQGLSPMDINMMATDMGANAKEEGLAKGGKVPALVSPGEVYLPPKKAKEVVKDGKNPIKEGKKVPGKPKHPGNDYRNDVVPADLDEGGVVIPNSIMQSKDPAGEAAKFVASVLAKGKYGKKK